MTEDGRLFEDDMTESEFDSFMETATPVDLVPDAETYAAAIRRMTHQVKVTASWTAGSLLLAPATVGYEPERLEPSVSEGVRLHETTCA